jgi:mono/diheme cytochrome c family protein
MTPSPELIALGKTLYENNCTACHGAEGLGNGPAAATMSSRPRNFASSAGWVNGYHAPGIFKTLKEGVRGTSMASFDYLSPKSRMALVQYVQSLGRFPHDTASPQEIDALSRELATAGGKTPNKIPVSMAMAKLVDELKSAPPLTIEKDDQSPGAVLLRRVVTNPARASQFLNQANLWRVSYRDLASSVVRETPANGFSTSSATLNPAEWQLLHLELLKRTKSK